VSKNLGLLTFFASLLISGSSGAQDTSTQAAPHYPEHSVRMVVGFTAGGPTDVIARIIAEKLSTSLGQQFYVDNRPGAGGNIASAEVAKAAPDGYTTIVVSTGFMVNMSLYVHVPYDAVKDFAPITMVAYSPNVLLVHPSMPAKSVKELIELIKANPNKTVSPDPVSAQRRIFRGNYSSRSSAWTWCTFHFPVPPRRFPLQLLVIRRLPSLRCHRRFRIFRMENCMRSRYSPSSVTRKSRTYRRCWKPAILTRRPIP
jgi:hypothetical protein